MIPERIAGYVSELVALRHDLHRHPETAFEERRTSGVVAAELGRLGYRVTTGIAGTGVVGTLSNGSGRKSIGLRADMDALPIMETTGLPYASVTPGKMHACGHDGHTATLLGAARLLAETRKFDGTVHLIFQPAEEDIGGAQRMIAEGLFERFPCDAVFAFHNMPGFPTGQFAVKPGAIMAAVDLARVVITGVGGHSAMPHLTIDPIVAGAAVVSGLQTIVSRNIDPAEGAVVTVGAFNAGKASNVIPQTAELDICIRSCTKPVRDLLADRVPKVIRGIAEAHGCTAAIDYEYSYPTTINWVGETSFVRLAAEAFSGPHPVRDLDAPMMGSEDFAYMLEALPGCYFMLGNGDEKHRKALHNPSYDFNDALLPIGVAFWAHLVERYLPA
ncbi:MAG: M20 aminoacylase family protein [Parvibaculaceae bacterium]